MSQVSSNSVPSSLQPITQDLDWWLPRHQQKLIEKQAMSQVDLVFLGDSITEAWENKGADVWKKYYDPRNALNLGFRGDRTENVLWRLEQGEVDGINPKVLVLLIGTNNTGERLDKPENTALGIKEILSVLSEKLPDTKILLLAVFPRSVKPTQRLRVMNDELNAIICDYADDKSVFFLDINACFLDESSCVTSDIMDDFLHPNASQYQVWADAIEPFLEQWL